MRTNPFRSPIVILGTILGATVSALGASDVVVLVEYITGATIPAQVATVGMLVLGAVVTAAFGANDAYKTNGF